MTVVAVLAGAAAVLLGLAVVVLVRRQAVASARLAAVAHHLDPDVVVTGTGPEDALAAVERAAGRRRPGSAAGSTGAGGPTAASPLFEVALAAVQRGVVLFDHQGTVTFRNQAAAEHLGGRHGAALIEEAVSSCAAEALTGREASRPVDLFGPPRRTVVIEAAPLRAGTGALLGALVAIDDVTERRRLEAVRRDFVANISHELKTPVGALGLLAETMLDEDDPELVRRLAERMHHEAFRVAHTIDDLLELSRIESGQDAQREPVAVTDMVLEAVDRVRAVAANAGIEVEVDEPTRPLHVQGDRRQLVSAVYNLLENAVKYSDAGASVTVRSGSDGRWVDIAVQDHGIGIPRRDLERVFERFYRVDRARSRETGGTGLGLAIVRHVVNNHAGEVRVDSREGQGSTFTLRLPAADEPEGAAP